MSVVSDVKKEQQPVAVAQYDAVIVGAGPYGLAMAAHLRGRGLKVAIFGKVLELWRNRMPKGMFLRSHWWATNLSDPRNQYSFERFYKVSPYEKSYPVPIEAFIDYVMWFQLHAVPDVDETYVETVERQGQQFLVTLVDGRKVKAPVVVMAMGLYYYANRPAEYDLFPAELVTHSFEHSDFSRFAGKQIAIVGGGQSAVEYSALLHEAGASVHLVSRRPIHWLEPDKSEGRSLIEQLKEPNAAISTGWESWMLEYVPYLFYRYPQYKKDSFLGSHYNAAANDWLHDRVVGKVSLHEKQVVNKMKETDNALSMTLSSGEQFDVDHVLLATGYKVDINKLPMIHPSLLKEIQVDDGSPLLNPYFQSSVPGLYFVGLSSLRAFGPLYRFVVGNKATAQRVTSAVVRQIRALAR
ncbi:NAD(P)/FAD-dependent oxidoreductase [Ktedonosporobacter rubrisoli]|uniref:NAD(P)/FAD-dependent oxidoreductase n=1 Tax=Ktedonosporobacter rubrisoli TaxID=2509675 RepID=A0A4P6JSW7_KTERU|nr:NAD(P)-binding domain-containing protein [Ktedonosporobacter rubrisoli]QBD78385.1 NAD(P)/FAD-dependent oxidoreductase [Ktedonosporobacter rubrisoli]